MAKDIMNMPASKIPTACYIELSKDYEPELFFDGDRFMRYVDTHYDNVDVATFSISNSLFSAPLHNVNRLIFGLKQCFTSIKAKEKRYVMNNHVKLFICRNKKVVDVFIGSQNLTHGTNLNTMYKVRQEHVEPLICFFERLWKSA